MTDSFSFRLNGLLNNCQSFQVLAKTLFYVGSVLIYIPYCQAKFQDQPTKILKIRLTTNIFSHFYVKYGFSTSEYFTEFFYLCYAKAV